MWLKRTKEKTKLCVNTILQISSVRLSQPTHATFYWISNCEKWERSGTNSNNSSNNNTHTNETKQNESRATARMILLEIRSLRSAIMLRYQKASIHFFSGVFVWLWDSNYIAHPHHEIKEEEEAAAAVEKRAQYSTSRKSFNYAHVTFSTGSAPSYPLRCTALRAGASLTNPYSIF